MTAETDRETRGREKKRPGTCFRDSSFVTDCADAF